MSVINSIPLIAAGDDGYQISRSVRLRSSASAYFNRTPASAGNRKTWTWSGWVKRGSLSNQMLFMCNNGTTDSTFAAIDFVSDALNVSAYTVAWRTTTQVFRDPSAWYHIIVAFDTTQATAGDRVKVYVNGVQVTSFSTSNNPTQNTDYAINQAAAHTIAQTYGVYGYFDGYLTEVNFIDGQALTPASFGETDALTGVWKPKKYAGTYGTNGFYLNFSDNSAATAAAIGKDSSGNGNNWTPNNISVTAGVTYDSMLDVPTMWADGGNGRGNYCTLNPLYKTANTAGISMVDGNLNATSSTNNTVATGTIAVSSGKWYLEAVTSASGEILGWSIASSDIGAYPGSNTNGIGFFSSLGRVYDNGSFTSYGAGGAGTTIGLALDLSANKAYWSINGVWQNSADPAAGTGGYSIPAAMQSKELTASFRLRDTVSTEKVNANFGQRPFAYTPPTGFKALNTQNLPDATIKKGNQYFDATTYMGNGSTQSIVNAGGFQPDFVWVKKRSALGDHVLCDSVRGAGKGLFSNLTNAENASMGGFTSFNSNGWSMDGTIGEINANGSTLVGWQWKESVSAGFDIVTYTTASGTVNHSLGVKPAMFITKDRGTSNNWHVWHKGLASETNAVLQLNTTSAQLTAFNYWGSAPTSTTFGDGSTIYGTGKNIIAYLFAEVAGFSKFGSYTGNGSADGPFVYCGFRPRFIMFKRTDTTASWRIIDTARETVNATQNEIYPNLSNAEAGAANGMDILSNGFKLRGSYAEWNGSGGTYIFAAFAENPFKNSLAR